MVAAVGELEKRLYRLPDGEVNKDQRVAPDANRGRITLRGLVTPDEARRTIAQRVHAIEIGNEIGDARVIERSDETGDVVLSKLIRRGGPGMPFTHGITLSHGLRAGVECCRFRTDKRTN